MISANPIENFEFSSTKKKNKLLSYKSSLHCKVEECKTNQIGRNDSTISNNSEASNEKKSQFNRFAKLAECNSKEKETRNIGLTFHRIASQQENCKQMVVSDAKSEQLHQTKFPPEPKRINFDELIIKPKNPNSIVALATCKTVIKPT
jgi:hypothetical protein